MSNIVALEDEHRDSDQVFSVYHGDELLHVNASLLGRMRVKVPEAFRRITMTLSEAEYRLCTVHRGIEEEKVANLRGRDLREPGLGIIHDDHTFCIVDGHHRLVRRYRGGLREMDFYVTAEMLWRQCLVPYPKEYEKMIEAALPPRVDEPTDIASRVKVHR